MLRVFGKKLRLFLGMQQNTPSLQFHFPDTELTSALQPSATLRLASAEKVKRRQDQLRSATAQEFTQLFQTTLDLEAVASRNIENLIGAISVPVGVAGPVAIHGQELDEEVVIPLATTEGRLVASVHRGCKAINAAGGAQVLVKKIGMSRAPVFRCASGAEAAEFVKQVETLFPRLQEIATQSSQHLLLSSWKSWIRGRQVYLRLVFDPDQAMGMNMVTIASDAISHFLELETGAQLLALSSNVCCDKKDSVINRIEGRGYWAQAEVFISARQLRDILKCSVEQLVQAHVAKNLVGSNVAGSFSQNMQVGNVIAALYLATGQDLAHVTDGSQASTTIEATDDGIYAAVTLPNLAIGVVGGGTWLPAQAEARQLIRLGKELSAEQLAQVIATAALAAELSGMAAMSTHTLAQAHASLKRTIPE